MPPPLLLYILGHNVYPHMLRATAQHTCSYCRHAGVRHPSIKSIVSETFKRINAERKGTGPPYLHTISFLRGENFYPRGKCFHCGKKHFLRGEKVSIVEKMFLHGENIFSM